MRLNGSLTEGEAHIMALWDGGQRNLDEIADSTGYAEGTSRRSSAATQLASIDGMLST